MNQIKKRPSLSIMVVLSNSLQQTQNIVTSKYFSTILSNTIRSIMYHTENAYTTRPNFLILLWHSRLVGQKDNCAWKDNALVIFGVPLHYYFEWNLNVIGHFMISPFSFISERLAKLFTYFLASNAVYVINIIDTHFTHLLNWPRKFWL